MDSPQPARDTVRMARYRAEEDVAVVAAAKESAKSAGLRYINDGMPGIQRIPHGKNFTYSTADGKPVRDENTLARIKRFAIPPAWTDVWICPLENGHLQATGRDAKGRKQHRYHPRWREVRDESKYNRMLEFAKTLPKIRTRVERDLARKNLPREKVLATLVKILETGLIRVGNEEYEKQNQSYGLTTLKDRHAKIRGGTVQFKFKGKSGKHHEIDLTDARLARIVKRCQDLRGQELFQYVNADGKIQDVTSGDVNDYLREISGGEFTAKDFRTWAGTVLAAIALREFEKFDSQAQAKKHVRAAIERVAQRLGNTPTICRKCYVHPAIVDAYLGGTVIEAMRQRAREDFKKSLHSLNPEEAAVLTLLQQRLSADRKRRNTPLVEQLRRSVKAAKSSKP